MTDQGFERASRVKAQISVLESEIKYMKSNFNAFSSFVNRTLDSAGGVIVLTPDEVDMVRECKESKIEKLQKEFESLV